MLKPLLFLSLTPVCLSARPESPVPLRTRPIDEFTLTPIALKGGFDLTAKPAEKVKPGLRRNFARLDLSKALNFGAEEERAEPVLTRGVRELKLQGGAGASDASNAVA